MKLKGTAAELLREIESMPVIDCHEHLPPEPERLAQKTDVTRLFSHYCKADLASAGVACGAEQEYLFDAEKPLKPRWEKLRAALEKIRFGSYAYPAFAYVRDVLGFEDIDDSTFEAISERLQADAKPGLYRRIMADLCGIEKAIQCTEGAVGGDAGGGLFVHLCRDRAFDPQIAQLELETRRAIHTLDGYVDALGQYVEEQARKGAVGYKIGAAYGRRIDFPAVSCGDAERVFLKLRRSVVPSVDESEREALENYLTRRAVEACIEAGLVVAIHTGYQAGVRNDIRNARATQLWSLLRDYPQARFDLFHGSFPYVEDMTCLGKYFENVALNMCWMHIMSPAVSRRALSQWLDAVPVHKIFAFGGDYRVVEKVYGHLKLARANIAMALAEKVELGRFTESDALRIARMMFRDNPKRWYGLE